MRDRLGTRPSATAAVFLAGGLALSLVGSRPRPARADLKRFVATFSTTPRIPQQLARLDRLAQQKLWDEWIRTYQELMDLPLNPVIPQDDRTLIGLRYRCQHLLAAQPPAVKQKYRLAFDGEALRLYRKALNEADPLAMREVYSRYRYTSYGPRALGWIADRALDRGEFSLAYLAYQRLQGETTVSADLLLHLAAAADGSGHPAEARAALDRVRKEFARAPLTLGGEKLTGTVAADRVAQTFLPVPQEPSAVVGFGGADGARHMPSLTASVLKPAWEFRYPQGTQLGAPYRSHTDGNPDRLRTGFAFLSFPVARGNTAFVQGPRDLAALDATSGKVLWDQVYPTATEDELPDLKESLGRWGEGYPLDRPVQAAPVLAGSRLYARIPLSHQKASREDFWPADMALAAFDAKDGSPLWRRQAGGTPGAQFWNLPTVSSDMVLSGTATFAAGLTEGRAVALDAATGDVLWSTFLGSGSHLLGGVDGSPALVKDGEVWIESPLHTLTALDLLTGDIRLVVKAPVYSRGTGDREEQGPTPNWPISLLAAHGGRVLFADRWSTDVMCLEPATGKAIWTAQKAINAGQAWNGTVMGMDDQRLYVGGHFLQAIDLATGATAWTWSPKEFRPNAGYPVLSGDRIYFPQEGRLYVVEAATGKEQPFIDLGEALGGRAAYVSLTVVGDRILASSSSRVVAFRAP